VTAGDGIENLSEPLRQAVAAYQSPLLRPRPVGSGGNGGLAASDGRFAQRAEHFAAAVRFGLDAPDAMRRLHDLTKDLRTVPRISSLLPQVLAGALALTGADSGNVQIADPATGSLTLVTQAGFGPEFLEYFAVVNDDSRSVCGRAAKQCAQTVVADVRSDPGFGPHREIAAAAGFRAVQSTPLTDYAGRLIGVVSAHFQRPHRPSDRDLRLMELYADFAGEAVTRHLGASSEPGEQAGRGFITVLLDPSRPRDASVSVPFELWVMGQLTASLARRCSWRRPEA
jgi:GAF domain-containing protein